MPDIVTPEVRSRMMSGIRGKNTKPELLVRRNLYRLGFRYRLHSNNLPGRPDIVFPSRHAVIFVHGCFWHGHDCHLFKWPSSKPDFWLSKITRNKENDVEVIEKLHKEGWRVLTIFECALKGRTKIPITDVIEVAAEWLKNGTSDLELQGRNHGGSYRTIGLAKRSK